MKTTVKNLGALLLILAVTACQGQTREQQKQISEAEKMAAEAQRISDSIMNSPETKRRMAEAERMMDSLENSPQMQAFYQQMEEMEAQHGTRKEQQEAPNETTSSEPAKRTGHLDHLIITVGNAKKFDNWTLGPVEIVLRVNAYRGGILKKEKIGSINADGSFAIDRFPQSMPVEPDKSPVAKHFATYTEDPATNRTQYTGRETGIKEAHLSIVRHGENLGSLHLATSRQQVFNDSPVGMGSGDPGYRVSLWYADGTATVTANSERTVEVTDGGETFKNIRMTDVYDLNFKPGLNYMREEVVGSQKVGIKSFYKTMEYTTIDQLPDDVKWVISSSNLLKR